MTPKKFLRRLAATLLVTMQAASCVPAAQAATAQRDTVDQAPGDALDDVDVTVSCYGFYDEFDAKMQVTHPEPDERCVIKFPHKAADLKASQAGKAAKPVIADIPAVPTFQDPKVKNEVWEPRDVVTGISFFKPALDLLPFWALFIPTAIQQTGSYQRSRDVPIIPSGTIRSIDDTVSNPPDDPLSPEGASAAGRGDARPFTRWWQRFTSDANRMFSPGVVRLRLPISSTLVSNLHLLGVTDPPNAFPSDAPLPVGKAVPVIKGNDARMKTIDIQLQASDDLIGGLTAYAEHAILPVHEQVVPVVVPLLSLPEIQATIRRWTEYKQQREAQNPPLPVPPEVDPLILRMRDYAKQIDDVRQLRAELPRTIGTLVTKQQDIYNILDKWGKDTEQKYVAYLQQRKARMELQEDWRKVQAAYTRFNDTVNMPWCKNDRFTTPIYSLLDPWLPGRPDLYGGSPSCQPGSALPLVCFPYGDRDFVIDFSTVKTLASAIPFPVLRPVQVRIVLPTPPPPDQVPTDLENLKLPELPPVPAINDTLLEKMSEIKQQGPPPVPEFTSPVTDAIKTQAKGALAGALNIINGMSTKYDEFWKSIEPQDYTDQQKCEGWGIFPCVHTEVDLIEQLTRIVARPLVFLKEDAEISNGVARVPDGPFSGEDPPRVSRDAFCNDADESCMPLAPETDVPRQGWQIIGPETKAGQGGAVEQLRKDMIDNTLDKDAKLKKDPGANSVPYGDGATRLYPIYDVPPDLDLVAPPSSSSSSAQSSK